MASTYPQPQTQLSDSDRRAIITDPNGAQLLVEWAEKLGMTLKNQGLSTSQIRALFGEVRQIQAQWNINRERAFRRLVLLKPKMAYRAREKQGAGESKKQDVRESKKQDGGKDKKQNAVKTLVDELIPALDLVIKAPPRAPNASPGAPNTQDDNFQRFVEFFEAILAYHQAYGGD